MTEQNASPPETESTNEKDKSQEYYGYEYYPQRRNGDKYSWYDTLLGPEHRVRYQKQKCEGRVLKALKNNPMIRLMMSALESAGCPIEIGRHICCEMCDGRVTGGYDVEWNQIVICQNIYKATKMPEVTLIHEMIHMFDHCVNKLDFKNVDHLACTEIRAANLTHCSFISSLLLGQSSLFNIKNTHQYCVKMKATQSVMLARNLDFDTALRHVIKVFDKCYNDLEPIGRRVRRNSCDPMLAYAEAKSYGYHRRKESDDLKTESDQSPVD